MPYYDDEMTDRAVRAFFNACAREGVTPMQPSRYHTHRDGERVTIANSHQTLAQYRVKRSGLKERVERVR